MEEKRKVKIIDEKTDKCIDEYTIDDQVIIQCYSPDWSHNPQAIIVNEKGRQALLKALQEGKKLSVINSMCTDGEGYYLSLIIQDADEIDTEFILPYKDKISRGNMVGLKTPVNEGYVLLGEIKENEPFTEEEAETSE